MSIRIFIKLGCGREVRCKGLCNSHYSAEYRNKDTVAAYYKSNSFKESMRRQRLRPKVRFAAAKRGAKDRGYAWSISFEAYLGLIALPCVYCSGALPTTGSGLDRKDNKLGYLLDNVAPCCTLCNYLKGPYLTYDETVAVVKALIAFRKGLG